MVLEIYARNRNTAVMRKIRQEYPKMDMRKIEELLRKVEKDEAVIEVRINSEPLL